MPSCHCRCLNCSLSSPRNCQLLLMSDREHCRMTLEIQSIAEQHTKQTREGGKEKIDRVRERERGTEQKNEKNRISEHTKHTRKKERRKTRRRRRRTSDCAGPKKNKQHGHKHWMAKSIEQINTSVNTSKCTNPLPLTQQCTCQSATPDSAWVA